MGRRRSGKVLVQRGIQLTERQVCWTDVEADRLGISASEIIRRAIDDYIEKKERLIPRHGHKRTSTTEARQMSLDRMAA